MTTVQTEGFAAFETWLGTPLPADPIVAMRTLRREAAREIERLLAFLDATDGNFDLEDDGGGLGDYEGLIEQTVGEPALGWPLRGPSALDRSCRNDYDTELDEADAEPSLAAPEGAKCPDGRQHWGEYVSMPYSQAGWARGNRADFEGDVREDDEDDGGGIGDHDGLIAETVGEPSLGATEAMNHETAWRPQHGWLALDGEKEDRRPPTTKPERGPAPVGNVVPIDERPITLVDPDGKVTHIDADGRIRR